MGQPAILAVAHHRDQIGELATLRGHDAVLGKMEAQCVDGLGALAHQHVADLELYQARLLRLGLGQHKAHGRARHRLADRLGVRRVGLAPLDIGLHVSRRHKPDRMAEARELAGPMVRSAAGLHADQRGRQCREEVQHR